MNRHRHQLKANQRGFSLAEILVATAIFAIIMVAALMIYDRSQQVFKSSVESSDTTQNVRVAFDKLVADLRMAGYDYDRDGIPTGAAGTVWEAETYYNVGSIVSPTVANGLSYRVSVAGTTSDTEPNPWPTIEGEEITDGTVTWVTLEGTNQYQQPDEQLEFIGPTAIVLRGNLDYETDVANEHGRETDLESGPFPVVTTANDEIVVYALKSDNADANADSLTFHADMSVPRDAYPNGGEEETVTVEGIDLSNANPPYTLYRFTFDENGAVQQAPLASNIRSLNFEYFQDSAGLVTLKDLDSVDVSTGAEILGEGPYDPANPTAVVEPRIV